MQVFREKDWNLTALRDIRYGKRKPILSKQSVNVAKLPAGNQEANLYGGFVAFGGENSNEINFTSYEHEDAISVLGVIDFSVQLRDRAGTRNRPDQR
jgi:hypothetical protein